MEEASAEGASFGADWKRFCARWKIGSLSAASVFAAASVYVFTATPLYRAQMQVLLPLSAVEDPADRRNMQVTAVDAFVVHSFADAVKDEGLSNQVIDRLGLLTNEEFNRRAGALASFVTDLKTKLLPPSDGPSLFKPEQLKRDAVLHDYQSRLKVVNDNKSLTLGLSFDASDPFLARQIVDAHAQAFIQAQVQRRRTGSTAKASWMKAELDRSAEEARAAQIAVQLHMSTALGGRDAAADQVTDLKFRQMVATSKQTVYDAMLRRYQDMIADERYEGSGIQILSSASLPTRPDFPKKYLMLSVAAVASLIFGMAVAWIVSIARRRESLDEMLVRLHLDQLGKVNFPKKWPRRWIGGQARLRTTLFWEQIACIRSSFRPAAAADARIIAVTSAVAKEGKSLLAAGLARTFACGGAKTLLLDLNVRSPRFPTAIGGGGSLQDLLAGSASLQHSVLSIDKETPLYLLSSSKGSPVDILAVSGPKMRAVLKQARKQFDIVVIDTPALEIVSDTLLIGALADEIVLAALDDEHGLHALEGAVAKLRSRMLSIKGVVITSRRKPSRSLLSRMKPYINGSRPPIIWPNSSSANATPLQQSVSRPKPKQSAGKVIQQIGTV